MDVLGLFTYAAEKEAIENAGRWAVPPQRFHDDSHR